jgi:hypothetical protein
MVETYSNTKFNEDPSSGSRFFKADRRTDLTKLTVNFPNFAEEPTKKNWDELRRKLWDITKSNTTFKINSVRTAGDGYTKRPSCYGNLFGIYVRFCSSPALLLML